MNKFVLIAIIVLKITCITSNERVKILPLEELNHKPLFLEEAPMLRDVTYTFDGTSSKHFLFNVGFDKYSAILEFEGYDMVVVNSVYADSRLIRSGLDARRNSKTSLEVIYPRIPENGKVHFNLTLKKGDFEETGVWVLESRF